MKILQVGVYLVRLDLSQPFIIALEAVTAYEGVIIRVEDDSGHEGWGEASPRPPLLGETTQSVLGAIEKIAPALLGQDPCRIEHLISLMDQVIMRNTAAKAALDIAIHDLLGRAWGVPIWKLLGGARERIETDFTISLGPPEQMAQEAIERVKQGYRILKLKLGRTPEEDIERVKAVRVTVGPHIRIRLDANQGWSRRQAVKALNVMAQYNIEFVEQPVVASDIRGLALVRRATPVPIMADESVHQPEDAIRVISEDAVDYINVKLMKSGGFWKASKIISIAEAAGIPCMVGGMVETDLGLAAAVQLACGLKNVRFGDLDMGTSIREKLVKRGGPRFEDGSMIAPEEPGLGILELNKELLQGPVKIYSV